MSNGVGVARVVHHGNLFGSGVQILCGVGFGCYMNFSSPKHAVEVCERVIVGHHHVAMMHDGLISRPSSPFLSAIQTYKSA